MSRFITLEGMEGAGKSTCIDHVCALLENAGQRYVLTREPGGTALAEKLRALLLNDDEESRAEPIAPMCELLLMFAGRAQHIEHVIKPALARGEWVVCDRFTDATYAYQGAGRGLGTANVALLEQLVQGELRPDKTLVLGVPYHVGMARVAERGNKDRFEREDETFFNKVRDAYLQRAAAAPNRYAVVDASQPLDAVRQSIEAEIQQLLEDD